MWAIFDTKEIPVQFLRGRSDIAVFSYDSYILHNLILFSADSGRKNS